MGWMAGIAGDGIWEKGHGVIRAGFELNTVQQHKHQTRFLDCSKNKTWYICNTKWASNRNGVSTIRNCEIICFLHLFCQRAIRMPGSGSRVVGFFGFWNITLYFFQSVAFRWEAQCKWLKHKQHRATRDLSEHFFDFRCDWFDVRFGKRKRVVRDPWTV